MTGPAKDVPPESPSNPVCLNKIRPGSFTFQ